MAPWIFSTLWISGTQDVYRECRSPNFFGYTYDAAVFPYQWYFASYGGFLNHYTAILEPCSAMPISVTEAMAKNQCSRLGPGENIMTEAQLFAGEKKQYLPYHE